MTWCKLGNEFFDQCAAAGLTDAATRTHTETVCWLYTIDREDVTDTHVPKHLLRRIAGTFEPEVAAKDLVECSFWRDDGDRWTVLHHADVISQSLTAQRKKRAYDKAYQRQRRRNDNTADATNDADNDVVNDNATTQTDRQTVSNHSGEKRNYEDQGERAQHTRETLRYCHGCGDELAADYRGNYCDQCDPWDYSPQRELGGGVS